MASFWDSLSPAQKSQCVDPKASPIVALKKRGSTRYAWDICGPLLDHWKGSIHDFIGVIIKQNKLKLLAHGGTEILEWSLCLVGEEKQHSSLSPTIIIRHKDLKVAEKASKIIKKLRDEIHNSTLKGYDFLCLEYSIPFCSDSEDSRPLYSNNVRKSLCGAHVVIHSIVRDASTQTVLSEIWTHATIGGIVFVNNDFHAITSAHAFPEQPQSDESAAEGTFERHVYLCPPDVELRQRDQSSIENPFVTVNPSTLQDLLVWSVNSHSNDSFDRDDVLLDREKDRAVFPILNENFLSSNVIELPNGQQLEVNGCIADPPSEPVIVASGVTPPSMAHMRSTPSIIHLPGSSRPSVAWAVKRQCIAGDSGTWVLDQSGNVFAMVVASSKDLTFCVELSNILADISLINDPFDPDIFGAVQRLPGQASARAVISTSTVDSEPADLETISLSSNELQGSSEDESVKTGQSASSTIEDHSDEKTSEGHTTQILASIDGSGTIRTRSPATFLEDFDPDDIFEPKTDSEANTNGGSISSAPPTRRVAMEDLYNGKENSKIDAESQTLAQSVMANPDGTSIPAPGDDDQASVKETTNPAYISVIRHEVKGFNSMQFGETVFPCLFEFLQHGLESLGYSYSVDDDGGFRVQHAIRTGDLRAILARSMEKVSVAPGQVSLPVRETLFRDLKTGQIQNELKTTTYTLTVDHVSHVGQEPTEAPSRTVTASPVASHLHKAEFRHAQRGSSIVSSPRRQPTISSLTDADTDRRPRSRLYARDTDVVKLKEYIKMKELADYNYELAERAAQQRSLAEIRLQNLQKQLIDVTLQLDAQNAALQSLKRDKSIVDQPPNGVAEQPPIRDIQATSGTNDKDSAQPNAEENYSPPSSEEISKSKSRGLGVPKKTVRYDMNNLPGSRSRRNSKNIEQDVQYQQQASPAGRPEKDDSSRPKQWDFDHTSEDEEAIQDQNSSALVLASRVRTTFDSVTEPPKQVPSSEPIKRPERDRSPSTRRRITNAVLANPSKPSTSAYSSRSPHPRDGEVTESRHWRQIKRSEIDPAALDYYGIQWKRDETNKSCILVQHALPEVLLKDLKLRTQQLRRGRHTDRHDPGVFDASPQDYTKTALVSAAMPNHERRHDYIYETRHDYTFDDSSARRSDGRETLDYSKYHSRDDMEYAYEIEEAPDILGFATSDCIDAEFELRVRDMLWKEGIPFDFSKELMESHASKETSKKNFSRDEQKSIRQGQRQREILVREAVQSRYNEGAELRELEKEVLTPEQAREHEERRRRKNEKQMRRERRLAHEQEMIRREREVVEREKQLRRESEKEKLPAQEAERQQREKLKEIDALEEQAARAREHYKRMIDQQKDREPAFYW